MSSDVQTISSMVDPDRARALQATLGIPPTIEHGDALPPFFHQVYFWDPQIPCLLGRDGHPKVGRVVPDLGLPRRMWAGGRLDFHAPFRAGFKARRVTQVENAVRKQGRGGQMGIVTMCHEIWQGNRRAITEWQDLVFLNDLSNGPRPDPPMSRLDEEYCESRTFDTTTLFRYSALTFNGHRIHYDREYARNIEGYSDIIVHGPLLAQLLMLLSQRQIGHLRKFIFRATSPLFHTQSATFCWKSDGSSWVRNPDGIQCMVASAE
ncbi:MAG: MaoC family dehydratase N-terminal domain-containing protein [Roseovarius sp.]|nr:MaoC family dehydratase N-terminal domain-containing protein [Roseovarius sp.]